MARLAALAALALVLPKPVTAQSGCELALLFDHLASIQETCCDSNDCSSGYPGAEDACTRPCGTLFEPFWDSALRPPPRCFAHVRREP